MALTKTSQKRIMDALDIATSLINSGEHPNDALVKAATELNVPSGHLHLMVSAVNTGTTNAHRMSHETTLEKAAEFPLADLDEVTDRIYPDTAKTKKAIYNESVVSEDYSKSPTWLNNKPRSKAAADINWKMTDKQLNYEKEDNSYKKAYANLQRLQHDVNEKKLELTKIRDKAASVKENIKLYFSYQDSIALSEVRSNAEMLFGKQANAVLADIPLEKTRRKSAGSPVNTKEKPYSYIYDAIKLANEFKTSQEAYNAAVKTANYEATKHFGPFFNVNRMSVLGNPLLKSSGVGSFFGGIAGTLSAQNIGREIARRVPGVPSPADTMERSDLQSLMDPAHESEIRNIQSEAMLNDLMANDDVIRGYDPEEVVDAFNEISQISPYAANKKVIMRDLMRQRLSGGPQALNQFTTGEALKQQESLRKMQSEPESMFYSSGVLGNTGKQHEQHSVLR